MQLLRRLTSANDLIRQIQRTQNSERNQSKLKQYFKKLNEEVKQLQPETKYHYLLFLAESHASKLGDFEKGQEICKNVAKDKRTIVKIEAVLRCSLIYAAESKYDEAIEQLEEADRLSLNDRQLSRQLSSVVVDYCNRLFHHSRMGKLLLGLRCQNEHQYQEANQYYRDEYDNGNQNKFFAGQSIIQLGQKCKDKIKTNDIKKCNVDNYETQKQYFQKIVELYQKHKKKIDGKINGLGKDNEYETKKLLAIIKIKKILLTPQVTTNKNLKTSFEQCLQSLKKGMGGQFTLTYQFTKDDTQKIKKANTIIKNKYKQYILYLLQDIITKNSKKRSKSVTPKKKQKKNYTKQESQEDNNEFQGSYMTKINQNSSGYEKRYFYFNKKQINKGQLILYYTDEKQNVSKDDKKYILQPVKQILQGKQTKALQRKSCDRFSEEKCFSIIYEKDQQDKSKNFYVKKKQDYDQWMKLLKRFENSNKEKSPKKMEKKISKMKKCRMD